MPAPHTKSETPSANPQHPDENAKQDSAQVKAADPEGLYVVVATPREGTQLVELHTHETAESRVSLLTYASKQHRKELADDGDGTELPEGGGVYELNRRDIKVYKLNTSEVTDF